MPASQLRVLERTVSLDARPDRLDLRDRAYLPPLRNLPAAWPRDADVARWLPAYEQAGLVLDQQSEGACTGFGLAGVIDYLHFAEDVATGRKPGRRVSPRMLYELARMYDEWPGEDYEGSSCRGALRGWHRHGVCRESLWPFVSEGRKGAGKRAFVRPRENEADRGDPDTNWDVDALQCTLGVYYRVDARSVVDMQAAIAEVGALYCSGDVHEGWDVVPAVPALRSHADLPRIAHVPAPKQPGGHAFALVGYNDLGFLVQNSWGPGWGAHGFAVLPYADWVVHGTDAWLFTLGAARRSEPVRGSRSGALQALRAPRQFADFSASAAPDRAGRALGADASIERRYRAVPVELQPWDTERAYAHTVVMDRGFAVRNDITRENPRDAVRAAGFERPLEWLKQSGSDKLLVYAHGGLNSERDSIERIRAIAPYAAANGIYPLFLSWRSGPLESLSDLVEEWFARLGFGAAASGPARGLGERLAESSDRALEALLRGPGSALWEQMKLNALRASDHGEGGCRLLIEQLAELRKQRPGLELHLLGHSAGAILLGAMLQYLQAAELRVASLRLWAPACTTEFALSHYAPQVGELFAANRWHVHVLSDENERRDRVGPYRKSLLYLVSRAFESAHKTALLGLARSFDERTAQDSARDGMWSPAEAPIVGRWCRAWRELGAGIHTWTEPGMSTGAGRIPAAHGAFDNSVELVGEALGYIAQPDAPKTVKIHRLDY